MKKKIFYVFAGAVLAALLIVNFSMISNGNAKGSLNLSSMISVFASGGESGSGDGGYGDDGCGMECLYCEPGEGTNCYMEYGGVHIIPATGYYFWVCQ